MSPSCLITPLSPSSRFDSQPKLESNSFPKAVPFASLHEWFAHQSRQTPSAIAVICGTQRITYSELDRRADRLARSIFDALGKTRQPVGLCVDRSIDLVVGILGILKAGCAYVPLDPSYPRERLAVIQAESRLSLIVLQTHLRNRLSRTDAAILDLAAAESARRPSTDMERIGPNDPAYVIFTSGSTGRPKGVQVTHQNVMRLFTATESWFRFGPSDVWTLFHSYAFDFSVWELWGALLYGGRLVVVPHEVSRSPRDFHDLLKRERVTVLNQTPSAFQQLIRVDESIPANVLALRYVILGGEALSIPTLKPWFDRHGDRTPQLVNMYGITETTVHVTYRPIGIDDLQRPADSVIGCPIPDLNVYLLDERRNPVPDGEVGEMFVAGPGVANGYLNRPELTAERFPPDPFTDDPDARMYKSGDLARRLSNGDLAYLGRIDHQVKIRGFRIELLEIESAIARHPSLRAAVVQAREDRPGDKRLVAYVVPRGDLKLDAAELRDFIKTRLPDYMVPAAFVALNDIPLTAHGKVDRAALPPPKSDRSEAALSLPETATQRRLQAIWEQVLQMRPIGLFDRFFDLGGDSLRAMSLFLEIEKAFGRSISPAALLDADTIAALAAILEGPEIPSEYTALVPLRKEGRRPPFFCVHPLGGHVLGYRTLLPYLDPERPFIGIQSPVLPDGKQFNSIAEMAAYYVSELMRYQPVGPYFIGGYSMGAMVAYEMARQLTSSGREVAFLAAIDDGPAVCPWLPQRSGFSPFRFAANLPHWIRFQICRKSVRLILRDFSRKIRVRTRKLFARRSDCVADLDEVLDVNRYSPKNRDLMSHQYRILKNYVPGPYRARLTAFRARTQSIGGGAAADLGWSKLVAGGVEVHVVPGEHSSMVEEPDVRGLGDTLNAALRRAGER